MVTASFKEGQKTAITTSLQKYDYGEVLRIKGLSLPRYVAVQFAVDGMSEALPSSIGETVEDVTDVLIPNSLLRSNIKPWNYNIMAYVYIVSGSSGKTEYTITIPVKWRPKTGDDQAADDDVAAVIGSAVEKMNTATTKAENAANQASATAEEIKADREKITTNEIKIAGLKSDLANIDYIVFNDKISKLSFTESGTSSDISLNGNTIVSTNATRAHYKAFINSSLFENGKSYIVVMKFKNNSDADISVYANAFSYKFESSIGSTTNLMAGKTEITVKNYTGTSKDRGFSIYSHTDGASYTVDIYIYDITDNKYASKVDFSIGGEEIKKLKSDFEKPYFEKILCTYGDSITAQQTWQDYIQNNLGFSKYYNHGVGGRRLMSMATDECLSEITEDFDVMLVMGGTNDWAQDRLIGIESDINTDEQSFTGTFYGGLNALLKKLTTKYPTKRIVFMTQIPTKSKNGEGFFLKKGSADGLKNSNGNTTRDFAKATLNACANNHVPCIDLNSLVGWNENNISSFVKNEDDKFFHPTSVGGMRMAECIIGFLKSIWKVM